MKKKYKIISSLILFGIILISVTFYWWQNQQKSGENGFKLLSTAQIKKNIGSKLVNNRQEDQQKVTKEYQKIVKSSKYNLNTPYVKLNPYQTSPLTALIIFKTSSVAKVSYTVQGKKTKTSISNQVNGKYSKEHQVPIVGLYADYNNQVTIKVQYKNGITDVKQLSIKTGALPKYIKTAKITVSNKNTSQMELGSNKLTLLNRTTKEPFAVDSDGEVRWYSTLYSQHMLKKWTKGHFMMLTKSDQSGETYNDLIETDLLGRVYKEFKFSAKAGSTDATKSEVQYTTLIHHDLTRLPNGNILATVSDGSSRYKEDTLAEISYKTGKVVKVIDFKRLLPKSMWKSFTKGDDGKMDWFHQNSVDYDKTDHSILVSSRNQDLIMKLDYRTNQIKWIYSGKKSSTWPQKYRKYLLKKTKGTTTTGGQHGLYLLSHKNGKETIILYNNNVSVTNGDKKNSGKYSEGVIYQINDKQKTIKQTWSYGKQLGKKNFTVVIGFAQKLANGNVLLDFGYKNNGKESNIIEVNSQGQQVWNATVKNASIKAYVYRAYRLEFYPTSYVFDVNQ
ncbi:MAG: aryl-sulfate sulfotransferase [Liquorilactobacillus nagelii]|uniref:aryl-sulfate sulfotransferase n=1 Tax=Liquorilactobacillus nagelii TaxID=82688 RepID=UPI002430FD92|nr:aryl-sulfate sulfotransferase [Liquorilactobacillus nagelii]MCI1921196.1 aryl-sulfate sulfotransferase [Liquorilactobacillus nagelii]MCI1975925.1 aryl-sulfate sulfotransferase [Liquorilactobacillus nagelii]